MKIYDNQLGQNSHHDTVEGLYEMILTTQCECGEGYDILDSKDGKLKCMQCRKLDNINTATMKMMLEELNWNGYEVIEGKAVDEEVDNMDKQYSYREVYEEMVKKGFDGLYEELYYMVDNCEKYGYKMIESSVGTQFEKIG